MLVKKPDVESTFLQLCIDGAAGAKIPKYVVSVPFIVVYDEKGRQTQMTDNLAFNWLRVQLDKHAGDFEAYDSGCMSSLLSDHFSYIGGDDVAAEHTFEWLPGKKQDRAVESIYTPTDTTYGGGLANRDTNQGQQPDALEKIMQRRNQEIPVIPKSNQQRPAVPDFSKPASQQPAVPQKTIEQQQRERKQDPRIASSQRGIDFSDPNFKANQINAMRQQQQQHQHQQHHHSIRGPTPGLRPVASVRNVGAGIVGRRLPQNVPR